MKTHPALTSSFSLHDTGPRCSLQYSAKPIINIEACTCLNDARELMNARAKEPFSLESSPLFRSYLINLEDGSQLIGFVFHHIIFDEWSWRIFKQNFLRSLRQEALREELVHWSAYIEYLSEPHTQHIDFWKNYLAELPIPSKKPNVAATTHRKTIFIPYTKGISSLCHDFKISPFIVFLNCYFCSLLQIEPSGDIQATFPIAGRDLPEFEETIGFFTSLVPIRAQLNAQRSPFDYLMETKANFFSVWSKRGASFSQIVAEIDPPRFNSQVSLMNYHIVFRDREISDRGMMLEDPTSKYSLKFDIRNQGEHFEITATANTNSITKDELEIVVITFKRVLETVEKRLDISLATLCSSETEYDPSHRL